ncbi:MAG: ATP-binding cassette domain-containing protein [Acidimicrobiaceae bacterium]|nr:ATP-binding cassette domain-containing protein [Acidimicrobiaceae bacterium]
MRRGDLVAGGVYLAAATIISRLAGPFWLFLLTGAAITAVVAVSVGVIYDNAGLLSLCQMTFAGIGAWTVGWLNLKTSLPYLAMLPFAAAVPCAAGVVIGIPALRLRGQNLAVFTLVFSAAVARVVFADGFPGLIEGNRVRPPGFADNDANFFLFCAAVLGLIGVAVTALRRTRTGRWWFSVRHSERATAAMGRSVVVTKLSAFAVSAAVAGVGGALLLALNGIVSGASFQPIESMTILTSALMFGAGHFEGAVLAGLFGQLIPNFLSDAGLPRDLAPMIFAVGGVIALSRGEGGLSAALRAAGRKLRTLLRARRTETASQSLRSLPSGHGRATGTTTVLDIQRVSVSYGAIRALADVSLSIPEGAFVGLIGPNGAGKSTLVDALSGFLPSHTGRILLGGEDITDLPPRKRAVRGLRRTFQQGHTPRDLTVGDYLALASAGADTPAAEALDWFSLPAAPTPIAALDVGSRRILEVCGALIARPRVALLDEPTAGLAGPDREMFVEALAAVTARLGGTVLLIENDSDAVVSLCGSAAVLDFGQLIATGSPQQVLEDPKVIAAYLGTST